MFCIKISFLEPEPVGAELLWVVVAGAKIFHLEPEPNKEISGAGEKLFGSATFVEPKCFYTNPDPAFLSDPDPNFTNFVVASFRTH